MYLDDNNLGTFIEALKTRYGETHRHYHNLTHIEHLLSLFEQYCKGLPYAGSVELAIWYHDAIYNVQSQTNEEDSALLLASELAGMVEQDVLEHAAYMIRCTSGHALRDCDNAELVETTKYFLDMDLASLGQEWEGYDRYRQAVRQEYDVYEDAIFNHGRLQFIETFLARQTLYFTDTFRERFEAQARENLPREHYLLTT